MNSKDKQGILGEIKVATYLIENGYDVFSPFSGKTPFDLVAHKDGKLYRVEVKSTHSESKNKKGWTVRVKKSRHNKNENFEYHFDSSSCDILAIYIEPEDQIVLLKSKEIKEDITIRTRIAEEIVITVKPV